jgi:hypothetical protein
MGTIAMEALFKAVINKGDLKIIITLLKSSVVNLDVPI